MLSKLVAWLVRRARSDAAKEIEILVMRPTRAASTTGHADELGRPRVDCRTHPTTPGAPSPRPARHAVDNRALAPPTRCPPLDHKACPARSTRHPRRPARPGHPPGHRESSVGIPADPR